MELFVSLIGTVCSILMKLLCHQDETDPVSDLALTQRDTAWQM